MSVFEEKLMTKVNIDDTEILTPTIIGFKIKEGHTKYIVHVENEFRPDKHWCLSKRYNDFLALHQSLKSNHCKLKLFLQYEFPPKRYIGNLDTKFVSERQEALQVYLDEVLKNPITSMSFEVRQFLDPHNYRTPCEESALSELRMAVRSEVQMVFKKKLPQIGWRLRKQSYIVSLKENTRDFLLQWTPFGPDRYLLDYELQAILKSFITLQHVHIAKIEKAGVCRGGGWTVHDIKEETLLDVICDVKKTLNSCALKKYSNYKQRKRFDETKVIEISSQILQALAYLHHNRVPYGHLHLGNILVEENSVKLCGIENTILGLPCYYRHAIVQCKFLNSMQLIDVYCFGLTMYEMLFATPFNVISKDIAEDCPPILKGVLESILSRKAIKDGLPSVKDLLNLEVFRRPPPNPLPYFKITESVQLSLGILSSHTLERIRGDHFKVSENKKLKKLRDLTENDALASSIRSTWTSP